MLDFGEEYLGLVANLELPVGFNPSSYFEWLLTQKASYNLDVEKRFSMAESLEISIQVEKATPKFLANYECKKASDYLEKQRVIQQKLLFKFGFEVGGLEPLIQESFICLGALLELCPSNIEFIDINNLFWNIYLSRVFNGEVVIEQFVCPSIDAVKLESESPEEYVCKSSSGCNLLTNIKSLKNIVASLSALGVRVNFRAVLADDDETSYIFPVLFSPQDLDQVRVERFFSLQQNDLLKRLQSEVGYTSPKVIRTSQLYKKFFPACYKDLSQSSLMPWISSDDFETELIFMRENLSKYYWGVFGEFSEEQLRQVVQLKFKTYGRQGFELATKYPFAVLLQSEKPPLQRTRMIQSISSQLPILQREVVYPYEK